MPKISDERKAERRDQILDGARRCFAEHGYEGATVAKLEREIGLSRGAIFNYYPSKEDLFIELAVRDNARMSEVWLNLGLEAVVREVVELDPAWQSVYLELFRRARTDPQFRDRIEARHEDFATANRARMEEAQRAGEFRDDLEAKEIGAFLSLVLNGLALQRAAGEELPSTDLVLRLLRDAIGGARRDTPARTPA
jgi:TetR/AcrR family transcriptional regulator, transcriptional repressor of aconitase